VIVYFVVWWLGLPGRLLMGDRAYRLIKVLARYGYYKNSIYRWDSFRLMVYDPGLFLSIVNRRCPVCGYQAKNLQSFRAHLGRFKGCGGRVVKMVADALSGGYRSSEWLELMFPRDAWRRYCSFCFGGCFSRCGLDFMCSDRVYLNLYRDGRGFYLYRFPFYSRDLRPRSREFYRKVRLIVPVRVYNVLRDVAVARGVSVEDVVWMAVFEYLERYSGRCFDLRWVRGVGSVQV